MSQNVTIELPCPVCDLYEVDIPCDVYNAVQEDTEVRCRCGARSIVFLDEGTDCDCDGEEECQHADGLVYEAYLVAVEQDGSDAT